MFVELGKARDLHRNCFHTAIYHAVVRILSFSFSGIFHTISMSLFASDFVITVLPESHLTRALNLKCYFSVTLNWLAFLLDLSRKKCTN
jgi:hypothetical protein